MCIFAFHPAFDSSSESILIQMKKLIVVIPILFFGGVSFSQIRFQKTYGGTGDNYGFSVKQTNDGGYIITGSTYDFPSGWEHTYLIKTDGYGDTLWTKTLGGTVAEDGYWVEQTSDGGYIIAGTTGSFGAGFQDIYLIKINAVGNTLWSKTFGGIGSEVGHSVQQTTDGGYIIAGYTTGFGAGAPDVYLVRTDVNGNMLWTKTFGGTNSDDGYSVRQTSDGGYIIVGFTYSFGAGNNDVYLIKTDTTGNPLWTKTYGASNFDYAYSVEQTTDGGYIIVGGTLSFGVGGGDVYLIKTDTIGNVLWANTFGAANYDFGLCVQQTSDGGYIVSGTSDSFGAGLQDVYLLKTNTIGNVLWSRTFGGVGDEFGVDNGVEQTTDGGYIIASATASFGAGLYDVYLIKTDTLGNSGCNESNPTTITNSTGTIVTTPATLVSSGGITSSPTTVTNSGGIVTGLCSNVGIIENNIPVNKISIFPNPSSGVFTIDTELTKGELEIYNVLGEKVKSLQIASSKVEIDLSAQPKGIYFIKLQSEDKIYSQKLIIE